MTDRCTHRRPGQLLVAFCTLAVLSAGSATPQPPSPEKPFQPSIPSTTFAPSLPTSVPHVIADAVKDFRHIPSWTNLAIFAAAGIGAALEHPSDVAVSRSISGASGLGSFFRGGETVGGAKTQLAAALGTYAIGQI